MVEMVQESVENEIEKKYTYDEALELSKKYFNGDELAASVFVGKYALKDNDGNILEPTPDYLHQRLAREFARIDNEKYGLNYAESYNLYYDSMKNFARIVPQGSPMSAIGNSYQVMSASNCVVVASPKDSVQGIIESGIELAQLYKRRCGVGIDISTLRPDGAPVNNAAKTTSGAWSFADFYSYVTRMIGQCIAKGERVLTKRGLSAIEKVTVHDYVWTKKGWIKVQAVHENGIKKIWKLTTTEGFSVRTSEDHKFLTEENGKLFELKLSDLSVGDNVVLIPGTQTDDVPYIELYEFEYSKKGLNNSSRLNENVNLPLVLDEKLSYLLGYMYGNANVDFDSFNEPASICISCPHDRPKIEDKLIKLIKEVFSYDASVFPGDGACNSIEIHSKLICHHLQHSFLLKEKSNIIVLPERILRSKSSVQLAFLAGFFDADADGYASGSKKGYAFGTTSYNFAKDIQTVLMANGIISKLFIEDRSEKGWKNLNTVCVTGAHAQRKLVELMKSTSIKVDTNSFISTRDNYLTPYKASELGVSHYKYAFIPDESQYVSANAFLQLPQEIRKNELILKSEIRSIEEDEECETYDLTLADEHLFWCEGLYIHNSGRRGALMVTIDVHHPDVIKFATMKHDKTKVTGANVSVRLSDEFLNAVDTDTEYEQRWPCEGEPKIRKMVRARDVWNVIVDSATNTAEPGLILWDTMVNNLPAHCYPSFKSISTNPCCFAKNKDVYVITEKGIKEIKQITSNDMIWIDSDKTWAKTSGYFDAGEALVYKVKFSNGESLYITENHKLEKLFYEKDSGEFIYNELVELKNLQINDCIRVENTKLTNLFNPVEVGTFDNIHINYVTIKSIKPTKIESVGCIEVEKYHKFTANGIISGNSEICLSEYDSCRLISLNLTGYVRNAFESECFFDFELFEKDIRTAMQMCDNLVDLELELIDKIKAVCEPGPELKLWEKLWQAGYNGRRTGLGTHGLGDTLAQLCIKYDSDEAIQFINNLYNVLRNTAYDASAELAKTRGSFPVFDWDIEKNCEFIKRLPNWLQEKIQKNGRRNISILTQAPTGSISIISKVGEFNTYNVSSGVEPVFRNSYIRRKKINPNDAGTRVDFTDALGDKWQNFTVFHSNVAQYLNKFNLSESDNLPDYFVTSDQIDWQKRIEIQATEQVYLDHSISSCLAEKSHLVHTDHGLRYIEDLVSEHKQKEFSKPTIDGKTINHNNEIVPINEGFYNGEAECLKVSMSGMRDVIGTPQHKIMVLNENYEHVWTRLSDVKPGDYVVGRIKLNCFGDSQKHFSTALGEFKTDVNHNAKKVNLPTRMSKNLARLLGYLTSDGFITENGIGLSQTYNNVVDDFIDIISQEFNLDCKIVKDVRSDNLVAVNVYSRILRDFILYLGVGKNCYVKTVPRAIFICAGKQQTAEFIKGLTLDGFVSEQKVSLFTSVSYRLLKEAQLLLEQFGIDAGIVKLNDEGTLQMFPNGKIYNTQDAWMLYCALNEAQKFNEFIGFSENRKILETINKLKKPSRKSLVGHIPDYSLRKKFRQQILPKIKSNRLYEIFNSLTTSSKNGMALTRESLLLMNDIGFELPSTLLDDTYVYRKVKSVENDGVHKTFDLHIVNGNSYLVNGLISHNTINLPKGTSSETVGALYLAAWKKGLKGVTVYVDGCRDGVLVTDSNDKNLTAEIDQLKDENKKLKLELEERQSKDNIIPRRPTLLKSETHKIKVDFGDGQPKNAYVTVSFFPGTNRPYEILVVSPHQGLDEKDLQILELTARNTSMNLRHGLPILYICEQLEKVGGQYIFSIPMNIAKVLRNYIDSDKNTIEEIKESQINNEELSKCPKCNKRTYVLQGGCGNCIDPDCAYSGCN